MSWYCGILVSWCLGILVFEIGGPFPICGTVPGQGPHRQHPLNNFACISKYTVLRTARSEAPTYLLTADFRECGTDSIGTDDWSCPMILSGADQKRPACGQESIRRPLCAADTCCCRAPFVAHRFWRSARGPRSWVSLLPPPAGSGCQGAQCRAGGSSRATDGTVQTVPRDRRAVAQPAVPAESASRSAAQSDAAVSQ